MYLNPVQSTESIKWTAQCIKKALMINTYLDKILKLILPTYYITYNYLLKLLSISLLSKQAMIKNLMRCMEQFNQAIFRTNYKTNLQ